MKHLLTLTALLISLLAMGQFPNLPYNPDDNADGLIGVADLQALLANYGSEFASAVVSEDGESAIVYMGDMDYFSCDYSCTQLPGMWQLPNARDLVPVYDVLNASTTFTYTWVNRDDFVETLGLNDFPYYAGRSILSSIELINGPPTTAWRCYCAAKQLPRVEYDWCYGLSQYSNVDENMTESLNEVKECVNEKLASGWQLLGTTQAGQAGSSYRCVQALWRWAE